jgi:sigma-B regulation protein RsbU (phosphoserine phosphatase)
MWQSTQSNKFITMFYAVLDPATHQMDYINAGHNRPFLIKPGGKVEELGLGGMVLGLFPAATYEVGSVYFEEGTELIIFTDGLSEVTNNENEEYGDVLMMDTLLKVNGKGTAEEAKCEILDDALEFCSNEMVDDLTLLLVRRKKGTS